MELEQLLERVKAANGPDRQLDALIYEACGYERNPKGTGQFVRWPGEDIFWQAGPCTASIDAALSLVERVLPLYAIERLSYWPINPNLDPQHQYSSCSLFGVAEDGWHNHSNGRWEGIGRTPPLAILAALLTALIAQKQTA